MFKLQVELWKIIKHYFPGLIPLLRQRLDMRHQGYITYENHVLLFVRILGAVFQIESMRGISEDLNRTACIENISQMLGLEGKLTELPHWSTINNYLEKLRAEELEEIIPELVNRLTRMRTFENSRIRDKYWQILVDATHLYTFEEPHCEHCLVREFKNKQSDVVRREYYHVVLEAKLLILGKVVISISTEFIENESPNVSKQDCELKAFYRLANKLKARFPRLPMCLCMDSLYAADPVFSLCKKNNWAYIIRFKDGSIKSVSEEFHALKEMEASQSWTRTEESITLQYKYVLGVPYKTHTLNVVECHQSDKAHPFVFITELPITRRNCEQFVVHGRNRWKIENEGFNTQKNHGYNLEHMFSKNYTAMKNHYYLIQIGHMISQLLEAGLRRLRALASLAASRIIADVKESFRNTTLNEEDVKTVNQRTQYRFSQA